MSDLAIVSSTSVVQSLPDAIQVGKILAQSKFFKGVEQEAQAVAKVLRGLELGIPPVAALEGIYAFDGKTSLSAHTISALIKKSGKYNYRVIEATRERCEIHFFENGELAGPAVFTFQDALDAKLTSKDNWSKYREEMIYARAMSKGARRYCSEIFMGPVYTLEELGSGSAEPMPVIQPLPEMQQAELPSPPPIEPKFKKVIATPIRESAPPPAAEEVPWDESGIEINLTELKAETDVLISALGWTPTQGKDYLTAKFGKPTRNKLTPIEYLDFRDQLVELKANQVSEVA